MKVISLEAENFKRIKVARITPAGALVEITGANGQGKSSVLDAIFAAFGGADASPDVPIRTGATSARVRADCGEIIVTRKYTKAGTTLEVKGADGSKHSSPQKMLDALLATLSFDPLAFSRMPAKEQLSTLRGLVKVDIDLDKLDAENAIDFEARTEANRVVKSLTSQIEAIVVPDGTPTEPVDIASLSAKLTAAIDANADIQRRAQKRIEARQKIDADRDRATALRAEADKLDEASAALEQRLADAGPLPAAEDIGAIRAEFDNITATNAAVAKRQSRAALVAQRATAEKRSEELTAAMQARTDQRAAAISAAKMPVDGLSFGDGHVIYGGLPLDQASGAQQLRISVAIAMSSNPKLRVLRVRDGSLLDPDGLELLRKMAEENDFQVWIERVDVSGEVGIVMVDGEVAGAAGETASGQDGAA